MDEPEQGKWSPAAGRRLRMLRRERGLTLRVCAQHLQVSFPILSKWETGTEQPSVKTQQKIAAFLDVKWEWLVTGSGPIKPDPAHNTPWPAEEMTNRWHITPVLPPDWPPAFQAFMSAAVEFGLNPSSSALSRLVYRARELGTEQPLPPELEAAVRSVTNQGFRWPGFAEMYLRGTDAALDSIEEIWRRLLKS